MPDQENVATEGGLNADNLEAVREELSGGVQRGTLTELDKIQPPPAQDQQEGVQGESTEGSTTDDSIGLSDDEKPSTDDASDDRGEVSGESNDDSATTPAEDDSPFTTVEDEKHDDNTQETDDKPVEDTEYFNELSNQIGFEVSSDEDVVNLVRNLSSKDPLEGLSPLLKQAAEFEQNGGDIREYFNVLSVNTDNMSDKDAMWHKFKMENSSLSQENGDFAKQKFERDFKMKYKILSDSRTEDDFDTTEEYNAFQNDKEYASQELKYEASQAKESLSNSREEALKTAPAQSEINEEEQKAMYEQYRQDAEYYKANFDTLQIPIDAEGKTSYNIGLNEMSRPIYNKFMDDPATLLEHIGISSDQKSIDSEAFASTAALVAAFAVDGEYSVGTQFAKAMTERLNRDSVETRLENPAPEGGRASSGAMGGDELQEAIDAFRNDVVQQRRR